MDSSWDEEQAELQYATWSPVGSGLFFVYRNDIYYKPDPKSPKIVRITDTGEEGLVFNGIPDWVYEGTHTHVQLYIAALLTSMNAGKTMLLLLVRGGKEWPFS